MSEDKTEAMIKAGLRTLAAAVPGASSLVQLWSEYESRQQNARVEEFFERLRFELMNAQFRISAIEDIAVSAKAFPELLERAVAHARRTESAQKLAAFARIVAGSAMGHADSDGADAVSLLDSLDSLTEIDIEVLAEVARRPHLQSASITDKSLLAIPTFPALAYHSSVRHRAEGQITAALSKLEARGILEDCTPARLPDLPALYDQEVASGRWFNAFLRLSDFGRQILILLVPPSSSEPPYS